MEENLRLTVFAQSNPFQEWLRQFVPEVSTYFEYRGQDKNSSIYIKNSPDVITIEDQFSKILGYPKETRSPQADTQYEIELCQGSLEDIQSGKGVTKKVPFLKIIRITRETTEILLNMNQEDIHAYLYVKEVARQIANRYPETKRHFYLIDPRTTMSMNNKVFDFRIMIDPENFMSWCSEFLSESYPGGFFENTSDNEIITHIRFEIFPTDDEVYFWEIIFFATEIIFPKNRIEHGPYLNECGPVASIKATPSGDDEIHVRCFCELDSEQLIEWFNNLKNEITQYYSQGASKGNDIDNHAKKASAIEQNQTLRAKGLSRETERTFTYSKEFKDENPSLTQSEVAELVNAKYGTIYSARDVSYAYKAFGYKWKRGVK